MYFVVTGAAGFIGSNLVRALNARGETRILAIDDLTDGDKFRNLVDCEIADYLDSDIPFLYASSAAVYGAGPAFREERACETPLNVYGYSKFLFDQHVRRVLPERTAQVAGFRYFNVYGSREGHKARM